MSQINQVHLGAALRDTRAIYFLSLRDVAEQTGISASTLSRVENGKGYLLEVKNFLKLCDWLGIPPAFFIVGNNNFGPVNDTGPLQDIEQRLRACPELPELCRAVADVLRLARCK